ncbi:homoserine kinase [Clostridium botulinum]|uniref:homoserine kinase n=1 Tax=Clostridium botulinum TaxID=1491 RepID=UPI0004D89527|nr:homoserine kinase [Clostridium botulinum]KEI06789.1 serine kinase [Clostridium botulinum C/D str. BKT75002]KEI10899.1 serine kinase [Clostridium botulinum C/D str. BKT2873]QPW60762.1 homoserine kinase [Clostridium botulinum]
MLKVKIPATTANLGPGFDSFGMALDIYNEICIEEIEYGFEILQEGKVSEIPLEDNLIYTSFVSILKKYNYKYKGFKIDLTKCNIPISRGLGSSAACIVGGISAANKVMGNIMSVDDIIKEGVRIEGHPDNIVPAVVGGMTISIMDKDNIIYSNVTVPQNLMVFVMIPDFKLSTEDARNVLPKNYTRKDCVFNISRAAMLVNIMNNGELDKLRICVQDKIHQEYRKSLINGMNNIFVKAKEYGSLGEFISGSGSTLIAIIDKENHTFCDKMIDFLKKMDGSWKAYLLQPNFNGVDVYTE